MSSDKDHLGGIIHTYQKYDPVEFPSPTAEPPDLISPAMEHLLHYGSMRELTEEELARAIHLDPRQIANLGPSLEALIAMLEQIREAMETAQIGMIDMEMLSEFVEPGDVEQLSALQQQIQDYLREMAERQGLEQGKRGGFQMTPKAMRLFQGRLLERIFSQMQESRSGRHANVVFGEGAAELQQTKPYEFGDSVANMDIPATMVNAM